MRPGPGDADVPGHGQRQGRPRRSHHLRHHGRARVMTEPLVQGIIDEGVDCKVIKLRETPMSAAITDFWKSRAAWSARRR